MSLQLDQVTRLPDAAILPHAQGQQQAIAALLLALAAVVLLYHATFWSMLELWSRSQTFAHGFLIVPISCWLAWRQRARLAALAPQPSWQGLLLLGALGLAWLLADAANVPVVEQYAATAMLPACVLAILGWPAVRLLAFPLAYLFLAVPFGEVFLDPLIDFTAAFTVTALQWTGVPVFRDGNNFSLPTGNWSVVEACSGLRYLIAALALGALYAHVHCHSARRRLAVMAAALLVPILANGVRAYLIVMLGHYSDMRVAVGVDHLIYGWLFFGLVALLLFLASRRWRTAAIPVCPLPAPPVASRQRASKANTLAALLCLPLCALWPALAQAIEREQQTRFTTTATLPALQVRQIAGWQRLPPPSWAWRAPLAGAPRVWIASQAGEDGAVQLQLAWYGRQARSSELLSHIDQPYGPHSLLLDSRTRRVALPAGSLQVRESLLARPSHRLLIWRFYRQSGVTTANGALVKLLLARGKLLHSRQDGALIIVSAPYEELGAPPRALLQAYLRAALPSILQAIEEMPHD